MNETTSETVESITQWADETFGPCSPHVQIDRAYSEMLELVDALLDGTSPEELAEEAADVCICLFRVIGTLDPEAINKKMAVNRARKWAVKNGVGQHITIPEGTDGEHV